MSSGEHLWFSSPQIYSRRPHFVATNVVNYYSATLLHSYKTHSDSVNQKLGQLRQYCDGGCSSEVRRRLFERSKLRAANDVGGGGCPVRPAQHHCLYFVDQQQQQMFINNINNNVKGGGCRSDHQSAVIFKGLTWFSQICSPLTLRPPTTNHKQSQLKLQNSWLRILYNRNNPVVWNNDEKNPKVDSQMRQTYICR